MDFIHFSKFCNWIIPPDAIWPLFKFYSVKIFKEGKVRIPSVKFFIDFNLYKRLIIFFPKKLMNF